jgi:hypothetical protein
MFAKFEIFRVEDGGVLWLGSAQDLEEARLRIVELAKKAAGEYLILDYLRGRRTPVFVPAAPEAGA